MIKTVIGSFDTIEEAERVVRALREAGFLENDMSIVASNVSQELASDALQRPPPATVAEDAATGAATGVVAGGALGGAAGLTASLLGLAIPGIGAILAAGPIAAALLGAGAGAVAGGLIGGLVDLGVSETDAEYYAEAVRRGGALVTVRTDVSRTEEAERIMRELGAIDIEERVARWRSTGWKGYNPKDPPWTHDEIERARILGRTSSSSPDARPQR
jgi:hypothetical protein